MSCKVYLATAMTGRTGKSLNEQSVISRWFCNMAGLTPLCPIHEEGVPNTDTIIHAAPDQLRAFWRRDKEMIREAHVMLDMTGPLKSEGVAHEIGYARYFLFTPVVRLYPRLGDSSIAREEDDFIAGSMAEAVQYIDETWGTPKKRFLWRARLINRCFFGYFFARLRFLTGWF